ncbi:ABC transporter permease [Planotetraspora phitsanulokensis]|uniref:Transport permease protein n=1 Tax=Planotetraspora phitsanulokensis TaxID=575192 RepID=A0A8J3UCS9_9ACTN|nr:ABC transporter permease [Planotetraspora phitsanulokensis]GII43104.1 transport permease protein [Planotetraspora phitsanulokensis]
MSQPESAVADAQAGGPAQESLAALAERYGLRRAIARPTLPAYLRQLWDRRHFIVTYATSKNVSNYSESALGQLWQVLTPLLNAAVYWLMFGVILAQSKSIENYPAFLITGVMVFTFTQRTVTGGAKSISGNLSLIRALHFPRATLPLAYAIQELQILGWSMGVLIVLVLITGEPISWLWLLIPVALIFQFVFNLGASLFMARIGAFVRDISQLLPFILRTWLYASGVFYMISDKTRGLPSALRWALEFNPAAAYIEFMRDLLIYQRFPERWAWVTCIFWAVFAAIGGFWYFWRAEERYGRG